MRIKAFNKFWSMTSVSVITIQRHYWQVNFNLNAVFASKSFWHSEISVSCPSTKRSMEKSFCSWNFVVENVSKSLVLIFSIVLEWLNSFLFDSSWGRDFASLDVLLTSLFSDDLKFESTTGCFLSLKHHKVTKSFYIVHLRSLLHMMRRYLHHVYVLILSVWCGAALRSDLNHSKFLLCADF